MAQSRVTIKDVAVRAGVSITTVSHVLNDAPGRTFREDTQRRVREAAAQLGYAPNALARSLRTARSETIALISDEITTTPFAARLMLGAQDAAKAHGTVLFLASTGYEPEVEAEEIQALLERRIDGVVYAALFHREVVVPTALADVPVVVLNAFTQEQGPSWIVPDEVRGGRDAAGVLLDAGHSRIALVNNEDAIPARFGREEGFLAALAEAGVACAVTTYGAPDTAGGYVAAREALRAEPRPTALFCFNDRMALGAYRAASELGLRIPEDLSVVGFDDQPFFADAIFPALTTLALPHYEMGVWAVDELMRHVEAARGGAPPARTVKLRCPVIHRDSVSSPSRVEPGRR